MIKRLQAKIDNPNKSVVKKKKVNPRYYIVVYTSCVQVKTSIDRAQKAILELAAKARRHESEWPPEEKATNGKSYEPKESSSGTDADTDENEDNEDALFGDVKRKKRRKRPSDDEVHTKKVSSDEYSDEEFAKEMKKKRQEEAQAKKERQLQAKLARDKVIGSS